MTVTPGPNQTDRLATLEAKVSHIRELMEERDRAAWKKLGELSDHNRVQDMETEKLGITFASELSKLREMVWSFLKWLGGALFAVLLSIILKKLNLV